MSKAKCSTCLQITENYKYSKKQNKVICANCDSSLIGDLYYYRQIKDKLEKLDLNMDIIKVHINTTKLISNFVYHSERSFNSKFNYREIVTLKIPKESCDYLKQQNII